ncbi:MAG: hypothetical protein GPJ54_02165 [Candidatus Heimdallarchaeota archaeon]|nr:hypothetical protein [Candidatus Heimdallarchaeota archaeon]
MAVRGESCSFTNVMTEHAKWYISTNGDTSIYVLLVNCIDRRLRLSRLTGFNYNTYT